MRLAQTPHGARSMTFRELAEQGKTYGYILGFTVTWIGVVWYLWRHWREWKHKEFLGHVNFSLNFVVDGTLVMRTLAECSVKDVWLNDHGVRQVARAARRTTIDDPILRIADADDRGFVNRAIINVLSERFAEAHVAQALGMPARIESFRFAITFERALEMRTYKLRVLLAKEEDLTTTFAEGAPEIQVASPVYRLRLKALRTMSDLFRKVVASDPYPLGRVVLGVRE